MDLDQYCFGCLTRKEENSIYCVNLENSALKIAIQVDKLFLCYLCKRASQQAELFIQNVQGNQMLLENLNSLAEPESLLQSIRTQIRPIHELTLISIDSIELGFNESSKEESTSVTVNSRVKVKQEMKEEDNGLNDDYVDDDNDFQGPFVKEEDFPLKALQKKEVEVEVIDLKRLKKSWKRGKYKKTKGKHAQHEDIQVKMEPEGICNIETVYITREQCLEERARQALDRRYVASTYQCENCLKGFNFKESYDKHMEKHNALAEPESLLQSTRTQIRPIHELTLISLDSIELGFNESSKEESTSVTVNSRVKVKQEMKEEDNGLNDDYVDDDNDFQGPFVKEEDFPLKALQKKEVEVEVIDLKRLKKSWKRGKYKKTKGKHAQHEDIQVKMEPEGICNIETVYITREQCLEERARQALDRRYVASTYQCENCLKGFNFKESYDKHMEKHNASNGDYECDICKQRMSSEDKLIGHKRYHEVRYRCRACGLTRVSRVTVQDHYYAFHTVCKHSCPHCAKSFKRRVSWRKHISNVHTHRRVTCAYCNKSYANKDVLKAHMIVQHPVEVSAGAARRAHVCADCGKAFRAPSQLRIHRTKHSPARDYYCVECDKSFKSASILKHHLKTASTHVSYIELPLPCEHCDKRFAIRRDLDRHTNRVHLNIKPFRCDQCDKAYVNGWSLNEHKRLVHEGFKRPLKYPCPMCDKVFDRNQVLKGHIRTHTGERPYQCARCPAQFSQASILGTHVRLVHLRLTRDGRPKPVPAK